jgi:hypothetical protein
MTKKLEIKIAGVVIPTIIQEDVEKSSAYACGWHFYREPNPEKIPENLRPYTNIGELNLSTDRKKSLTNAYEAGKLDSASSYARKSSGRSSRGTRKGNDDDDVVNRMNRYRGNSHLIPHDVLQNKEDE